MNTVIEQIYRTGQVEDADGNAHLQDNSPVMHETGVLLYELIRSARPRRTLEVGMAYGLSTLFICQALEDNGLGEHVAIDPYEKTGYSSIGLLNVERANLSGRLRFYEEASERALPRMYAQDERFDVAFIDGSHLFDNALVDFFYVDKMLTDGGHVAIDDLWMPAVRKVASFILKNKPYRLVSLPSMRSGPVMRKALRIGRRIIQNPLGPDWRLKLVPRNVAIFQRVGDDDRDWDFHRAF